MASFILLNIVFKGKNSRLTFLKCSRDINQMVDCAKIADCAIIVGDVTAGIETEINEFIDVCKNHGNPKLFLALTHIDTIENKTQQNKIISGYRKQFRQSCSEVIFLTLRPNFKI